MKFLLLLAVCGYAAAVTEIVYLGENPVKTRPAEVPEFVNVPRGTRVIGGENSPRGMFPYMVRLFSGVPGGGIYLCGGSLISLHHVLSADHCVPDNLQYVEAHMGVTAWGGPDHRTHGVNWLARRGQHPNPFVDLVIFGFNNAIPQTDVIWPIRMISRAHWDNFFIDWTGWIPGWGGVTNDWLQFIPVRYTPTNNCGTAQRTLCAAGRDHFGQNAVGGDSGGPMVIQEGPEHVLIGTVSYIFNNHIGGTHLPQWLDWISEVTGIPT